MRTAKRPIINFPLIIKVVGWLLMIEAGFLSFPLILSLVIDDGEFTTFLITNLLTLATGASLTFLLPKAQHDMRKRDGFLLTGLTWIVFSLFGMIPFMREPIGLSFSSAFFETISGFTTTGVSLLDLESQLPESIVLWRSLMQWIGGMGIIIFTLAVLPMFNNQGGVQMFNAEVTGITHDKLRPRVSSTAKGLWMLYVSFTVVCILLFWLGPMTLYESVCVALSVLSTGGFATSALDIAAWDSTYVEVVATIFMFLGATNFGILFMFFHGKFFAPWKNDVFRFFCKAIALIYILLVINNLAIGNYVGLKDLTLYPLFNIISVMSTTGYVVGDFTNWGPFVISIMIILMFFGACAGSTSGGAKLDRLLFMLKNTHNELYRGLHPNSILGVSMNGKIFNVDAVNKVIAFLSLYLMVVVIGGMGLTATGLSIYEAFYSSFACMSNAWISQGATIYGASFETLPDAAKWILSFVMLTGRLEVFTIILLLTPQFWSK